MEKMIFIDGFEELDTHTFDFLTNLDNFKGRLETEYSSELEDYINMYEPKK